MSAGGVPVAPVVHFEPASLQRSKKGSITGRIWFEFGVKPFPDLRWDDFVVVILGWWIPSLQSNARVHRLRFMDGPYLLEVHRDHRGTAVVKCVESEAVGGEFQVDFVRLREQILDAGRSALQECKARRWKSRDIEGLAACFE